ncbi:MAG TPA: DUF6457 domain-containing protein [Actinomycetota bacterium]|nr:DUF6457 domain-containing protein [Actinomycetota bacterium]
MTWLDDYAEGLARRSGSDVRLSREEFAAMLDLARAVAHRTERRFAPVSTFLAGKFVAARLAQGSDAVSAAAEALAAAEELLPPDA